MNQLLFSLLNELELNKQKNYFIEEEESSYTVNVIAPGIPKTAVKVEIEGNVLSITGKAVAESESELIKDVNLKFKIGSGVDSDNIKVKVADGIISLTVAKITPIKKTVKVE